MISGRTQIIAHLGYPTESFTAPMIYNPWFAQRGIARTTALGIVCMLEYFCYDRLSSRRRLNDKNIVDTLTDLIAGGVLGRRDRP